MTSADRENAKDDSMVKPIDKSVSEDDPTDRVEIEKIQLPEGLAPNEEDRDSGLFKAEPSFTYEKNAVQQSEVKLEVGEAEGASNQNNVKNNPTNSQTILDKYKERLEKVKDEPKKENPKEVRREFRRQLTIKKKTLEKEMNEIRERLDEWGDRLERVASNSRLISLLLGTTMAIALLFFLWRTLGNNRFILWFGLELLALALILTLSIVTIKMVHSQILDIVPVTRLKWWIYILGGMQITIIGVGVALMDYGGGFDMSGTRIEQSDALYRITGIAYIALCIVELCTFLYWLYLYRKYFPIYEEYYNKGTSDPTVALSGIKRKEEVAKAEENAKNTGGSPEKSEKPENAS